jgi:hypothetical protein
VAHMVDATWARDGSDDTDSEAPTTGEALADSIQGLSPQTDNQRFLKSQALTTAIQLGQTRSLMLAQKAASVPTRLLAILVLWLVMLFMSFGLFVRGNVTVVVSLFAAALAVCSAIFLILEMYQPYGGLIQVSSAPLRAALLQLGQ